jgi:hypothetical protein
MRPLAAAVGVMIAVATAIAWAPIASWSGSGTKETESFAPSAREWRVTWTAQPIDPKFAGTGQKVFSVQVIKDGEDFPASTINAGPGETSGESYVRGAGRYYLKINAVNAKWTLAAEQQ